MIMKKIYMKIQNSMEKLLNLLNLFEAWENANSTCINIYHHWNENKIYACDDEIINKRFWFICWLVYWDKIDFHKIHGHWPIIRYCRDNLKWDWNDVKEWVVLMLLSVQENPIDYLISILK